MAGRAEPEPAQAKGTLPPVLVVNAKHDLETPLPGARRMAQDFPEGRLAVVDSGGHWPPQGPVGASRYRRSTPVSLR